MKDGIMPQIIRNVSHIDRVGTIRFSAKAGTSKAAGAGTGARKFSDMLRRAKTLVPKTRDATRSTTDDLAVRMRLAADRHRLSADGHRR